MPLTKAQIAEFKTQLLAEKESLEKSLASNAESSQPVELDQTSVGRLSRQDALQQQQMALAGKRQQQKRLLQVESAIQRIEDESYGYCIISDEEISLKRLQSDPAATVAINKL